MGGTNSLFYMTLTSEKFKPNYLSSDTRGRSTKLFMGCNEFPLSALEGPCLGLLSNWNMLNWHP